MAWLWQRDIDDEKRTPHIIVKLRGRLAHRGFRTRRAEKELSGMGLRKGMRILDFGCGSGIYTIAAARVVGEKGVVHAVDLHPTILEMVENRARENGLKNIDIIYSDLETGLRRGSVDIVLLYGVLKSFGRRRELLFEAHRIMKKKGTLLVRQPGMKEDRIKELVLKDGFFRFSGKHGRILKFSRIEGKFHEI
ncbi:MAG: class I SAM-dependent methyltransferase [Candidatus Aenigmarchaeota archaeon]|nr:class I SAM-dependent methyltransferase [Candidatus Aenigmarchaeota archaeon]